MTKCWDVTVKIRFQKTLFSIFSLSLTLSLSCSEKSQLLCHEMPYREVHMARNSCLWHSQQGPAACLLSRSRLRSGTSEACQQLYVPKLTLPLSRLEITAALGSITTAILWDALSQKTQLSNTWNSELWKCQILNTCQGKPPNLRVIWHSSSNLDT